MNKAIKRLASNLPQLEDIDTSLVPESHYDNILEGPRPAMEIGWAAAADFLVRFDKGADATKPSGKHRTVLRAVTDRRGTIAKLLSSSMLTRLQLTEELIEQWRDHWHSHRKDRARQYMFITIITDSGNTLAREPFIDTEALQRRGYKIFREAEVDGNFAIEVQLVTNFPGQGHGGTHCWHIHCVATTDDPNCDIEALESKLRVSGRLSNMFGAPTVSITPVRTLAHLMRCCAYMLKAPNVGKRLVPHSKIPDKWTFQKVLVRPDEALRLGEALSQVEIGQLVHSVGRGKFILRPAMKAVRAWHKARCLKTSKCLPADFDLAKFWADIRAVRTNNLYHPYVFLPNGAGPPMTDWATVARRALDAMNAKRAERWGSTMGKHQPVTQPNAMGSGFESPRLGSALERLENINWSEWR